MSFFEVPLEVELTDTEKQTVADHIVDMFIDNELSPNFLSQGEFTLGDLVDLDDDEHGLSLLVSLAFGECGHDANWERTVTDYHLVEWIAVHGGDALEDRSAEMESDPKWQEFYQYLTGQVDAFRRELAKV